MTITILQEMIKSLLLLVILIWLQPWLKYTKINMWRPVANPILMWPFMDYYHLTRHNRHSPVVFVLVCDEFILLFIFIFILDYGCPIGHEAQCFNNSGHKEPTTKDDWRNKVYNCLADVFRLHRDLLLCFSFCVIKVSAILIANGHQMMLFKSKTGGSSDWLRSSLWHVGDDFNKNVASIDIDYW